MLSIVIPTCDTRDLTLACLRSLDRGGVEDLDVVVVDDGSRDETGAAIRREFPRVRLVTGRSPAGFTKAANRGLSATRGDLVLLLNSDTEATDGCLAALQREFRRDPELGIGGARLFFPDGRPQWSGGTEPNLLWFLVAASGLAAWLKRLPGYRRWRRPRGHGGHTDWVTGAAMAVRREVLDEIGPFDERFDFYAQDLDLCLRARQRGWRVRVVRECRIVHHHGSSIDRSKPEGSVEKQHQELLWRDLLRWARGRHGERWAARAAGAAGAGLRLRSAQRSLRSLFTSAERRRLLRAEAEVLRSAARSLRRVLPSPSGGR